MGAMTSAVFAALTPSVLAIGGAGAAVAGSALSASSKSAKASANAAADADARAKAAANELKQSQAAAARQAQEALNARRRAQIAGSQSIYTSPLGIGGQADVARKTLLGTQKCR